MSVQLICFAKGGGRGELNITVEEERRKKTDPSPRSQDKFPGSAMLSVFFWFNAMAGAIACGQTKQIKRQASNHANKHVARFLFGPTQWLKLLRLAKRNN